MALRLDDKKALVAEVASVAATAQSVVAAEYRGLTVTQMTDLRTKARNSGVYLRVVKNTLARKAIAGTQFEVVGKSLKGPLVLAFSKDDPGAAAPRPIERRAAIERALFGPGLRRQHERKAVAGSSGHAGWGERDLGRLRPLMVHEQRDPTHGSVPRATARTSTG